MRHHGLRYMPALDGLRALAVLAVLLYHGDVSWARGGYFGVDAFFVLSGFLITSLLLVEWSAGGTIRLTTFWARRARRLLPALVLVLGAVALYAAYSAQTIELHQLRRDALSTVAYGNNWNQILSDQSYFERLAAPSPLRHAWSLAIEEQFYLVWPLLVLGVMRVSRGSHRALLGVCVTMAATSALLMAALYDPGRDPSRVYYGTDTRAQSLLIGAALAVILSRRVEAPARRVGIALDAAAVGATVALAWIWTSTSDRDDWQYRGGFVVAAVLVAIVIASVTRPGRTGPVAAVLSVEPLRAIGLISYGLYLWHWPIYVFVNADRTSLEGAQLLAVRLAITFAVATASYLLVEQPIRHGALRGRPLRVGAPALAAALVTALVLATAGSVPPAFRERTASDLRAPSRPTGASALIAAPSEAEPLRVMLVGDSMATSVAPGLEVAARSHGFEFWDASVPGCGLASDVGDRWFDEWRGIEPACLPGWRNRWPGQLAEYDPDLVIGLFGAQDAFDRRIDGAEFPFDSPGGIALARQDLEVAVDTLSSTGARVVLLTTPYYVMGWPQRVEVERSPLYEPWIDRYNDEVVRAVAAAKADRVRVLDLNRLLDPTGTWTDTVNGIKVRTFDRCHLSLEGAKFVAGWLTPQVLYSPDARS